MMNRREFLSTTAAGAAVAVSQARAPRTYDPVIKGGRVID